jgi:hypothetical protein
LEVNFSCFAKIIWMPSWFAKLLELLYIHFSSKWGKLSTPQDTPSIQTLRWTGLWPGWSSGPNSTPNPRGCRFDTGWDKLWWNFRDLFLYCYRYTRVCFPLTMRMVVRGGTKPRGSWANSDHFSGFIHILL